MFGPHGTSVRNRISDKYPFFSFCSSRSFPLSLIPGYGAARTAEVV
jgi:hypothetical protein